jgi:ABC-type branched-subunit amino acid transport system substrate-binding protein
MIWLPALVLSLLASAAAAQSLTVPWLPADADPRAGELTAARADTLLVAAEEAQNAGNFWLAAWNATRVSSESRAVLVDTSLSTAQREFWETLAKRSRTQLGKSAQKLTVTETACLVAWWGVTPELSLHYAETMLDLRRRGDAAAEGLAFLAANPGHKLAGKAASLVRKADQPIRFAGGAHQSIFRVAAIVPLSGPYESYGRSILAGLILGAEEQNLRNLIPMRVVGYDSEGQAWTAARRCEEALAEGAGILVGAALSVPTLALTGIAGTKGVPLFSPVASEERVAEVSGLVFQTGLPELEQGRALARYAVRDLRLARIAVATNDGESGGYLAAGFREQAESWGAAVVSVETPAGARDFQAAVNQLRRESADGLLLPTDVAKAELWARALRRERYDVRILGSEVVDPQNLHADARKDFDGMVMAGLEYALPDGVFEKVDSLCQARFGFPADGFVRRGFLTGRILGMAIRVGVSSPAMMVESVSQRLVAAPDPEHPARNFVRWGDQHAQIPIYLVRRGSSVRVR